MAEEIEERLLLVPSSSHNENVMAADQNQLHAGRYRVATIPIDNAAMKKMLSGTARRM